MSWTAWAAVGLGVVWIASLALDVVLRRDWTRELRRVLTLCALAVAVGVAIWSFGPAPAPE
jgi:hypothetical protein